MGQQGCLHQEPRRTTNFDYRSYTETSPRRRIPAGRWLWYRQAPSGLRWTLYRRVPRRCRSKCRYACPGSCRKYQNVVTLENGRVELFVPAEPFDVIVLKQVLHHVVDPTATLSWAQGWLKPDGVVIVMLPSDRHLARLLAYVDTESDPLGRRSRDLFLAWAKRAQLSPVESFDVEFAISFESSYEYLAYLHSVGTLQKLLGYRGVSGPLERFLRVFRLVLSSSPSVVDVLGHSFFVLRSVR
jgi:SAM-dependent methyltransferase